MSIMSALRIIPITLILALTLACEKKSTTPDSTPPEGSEGGQVACTMDAKMCPDGSAVGREGPNCEFAPCPGEAAPE